MAFLRVLLLEDDPAIARTVAYALEREGLHTTHSLLLRDARSQWSSGGFDLLVLDVGLPDGSGLDLCREVRAAGNTPVLMLSARGEELDRVLGLELGADDYLAKPFSMLELLARVRALLRRIDQLRKAPASASLLRFGPWQLDTARRELRQGDTPVPLTLREFDLLHFLVRHPGQPFGRGELLSRVWGAGFDGFEHTVNSHINRLRSKIEADPRDPRCIVTVWGVGYRFDPPAAGA